MDDVTSLISAGGLGWWVDGGATTSRTLLMIGMDAVMAMDDVTNRRHCGGVIYTAFCKRRA